MNPHAIEPADIVDILPFFLDDIMATRMHKPPIIKANIIMAIDVKNDITSYSIYLHTSLMINLGGLYETPMRKSLGLGRIHSP